MKKELTIETEEGEIPLELLYPLHIIRIFYYPKQKQFRTVDGQILFNFYPLVPPDIVWLFLHKKKTMSYFNYKYRMRILLLYPVEKEEQNKE